MSVYAIKLPENMTFDLDGDDQPVARLQNGRVFPLKHSLVEALLFKHFTQQMHRAPTKEEMYCILLQCMAKAVETVRTPEEFLEDLQEQHTVIQAFQLMLTDRQFKETLPFRGTLTELRKELAAYADGDHLDQSNWPKANHFSNYLLKELRDIWPRYNVRIDFQRKNVVREYLVDWITPPPKKRPVTEGDAINENVASPTPPDQEEEETEEVEASQLVEV